MNKTIKCPQYISIVLHLSGLLALPGMCLAWSLQHLPALHYGIDWCHLQRGMSPDFTVERRLLMKIENKTLWTVMRHQYQL